jgi:putative membrane protein
MIPIASTLLLVALYAVAAIRVKRRRGVFALGRAASFGAGAALLLVAFTAPLEQTFARHMAQHLLIGDLAPLFLVLGLTGPLLRPALALRPVRSLRALAHPLVALPLWVVDLVAWHASPLFDGALRHEWLHVVQHACFFTTGALLWSALLGLLPGPRWFRTPHRLAYLGVMWLVSLSLSQVFIWSSHAYYEYGSVRDQRTGGGIMLLEGSLVMLGVLVWLLWDALRSAPGAEDADVVALPL